MGVPPVDINSSSEKKHSLTALADRDPHADQLDLLGEPGSRPGSVVPLRRGADETFAQFWASYPRKKAKQEARKAWDKAVKKTDPNLIIEAGRRYADSKPDPQYTPYPATWLNRGSWEDEPDPVKAVSGDHYHGYRGPTDQSEYDEEF